MTRNFGDTRISVNSYLAFTQNNLVEMADREGLNFDEKVLARHNANFQIFIKGQHGVDVEKFHSGELVLTDGGIIFLEFKGIISTKRVRLHSYDYDSIKGVRLESRGITGALSGQEFIVLDIDLPSRQLTVKYSCDKNACSNILSSLENRISFRSYSAKFHRELLHHLKPTTEASLKQISELSSIREILNVVLGREFANPDTYLKAVIDKTRALISEGLLDGIIDEAGNYVSRISLERKSVQYQVSIDFSSIFTQLKGKGIVLESLECPSCKGKLDYPDSGSIVSCSFCGSNVSAIDVFEKFKALLDI